MIQEGGLETEQKPVDELSSGSDSEDGRKKETNGRICGGIRPNEGPCDQSRTRRGAEGSGAEAGRDVGVSPTLTCHIL